MRCGTAGERKIKTAASPLLFTVFVAFAPQALYTCHCNEIGWEDNIPLRRHDREISGLHNILAVLEDCETLRLGLCLENNPYIVPMNFAYEVVDEKVFIYLHCASEGKKLDIIARNSNACFEADCSYKISKDKTACGWSAEFRSVMGEGTVLTLTDTAKKAAALDMLMKRHGFEGQPQYSEHALSAVTVLQISVTSMTGKSGTVS